jgi:hypothetical protein
MKEMKIRLRKGTFLVGGKVYPENQLEEVFTALFNDKPLPTPKWQ